MSANVSRILHAGYIFESAQARIVCDPLFENPFSQNCFAFPNVSLKLEQIQLLNFDAIFISHVHDDHLSLESLNLLNRKTPVYLFSHHAVYFELIRDLGFESVSKIEVGQSVPIKDFTVTVFEALDADVDSILQISTQEINILNVVDSWIGPATFSKLQKIKWDLVLWPFQTMREIEILAPSTFQPTKFEIQKLPPEWTEQISALNPRAIVPSSCQFRFEDWSWLNFHFFPITYRQFASEVKELLPETEILRLNPGESVQLTKDFLNRTERQSWVQALGPQDVDYVFEPTTRPEPVQETAKRFRPLTLNEKQRLEDFFEKEIFKRFSEMGEFEYSLSWCLRVFDNTGNLQNFNFVIDQHSLKRSENSDFPLWQTEIAETKLYQALFHGESLTSLYVRVYPVLNVDPLEDPLIRCLYDGKIASYQKAQLHRIIESK